MVQTKPVIPFFSIITCTKNSAKYLSKCLASLETQTFRDFEHIVIDGQSSDQTSTILDKSGVSYHTLAPRGIAHAMNRGLSYAGGQYVYFLNSDDSLYNSQVLQNVHDYLVSHASLDWVFGNIHETDGVKTIGFPPKRRIFQAKHPNLLKFYNYIPHQGTFVKKSVFDKFDLFDEKLKSMMDPEYWLRIRDLTDWGYMPVTVANYLIRPDSQSENISHVQSNTREYEQVQAKYLSRLELSIAKIINKILR
jgi:glycosyltransferase involved in cell wall biosynthesis